MLEKHQKSQEGGEGDIGEETDVGKPEGGKKNGREQV